jgi:uncharacterized protein involved in exopolysaccharide biosynthesis
VSDRQIEPVLVRGEDERVSLFEVASVILKYRRTIITFALVGATIALMSAMMTPRIYRVSATFLPNTTEQGSSDLAFAASRLGVRIPTANAGWGSAVYAELLRTRTLLEPIVRDTVSVPEIGTGPAVIMDLLRVPDMPEQVRIELAVEALNLKISVNELKELGAVQMAVTTRWPSLSLFIANRLIEELQRFNLETRKSQAAAERQFVERQAAQAEGALRAAENKQQEFLSRNRSIDQSPQLTFENDRLAREVMLQQEVYTSLVQSREEARIREIRDTPVITVLEAPHFPADAQPRKRILKVIVGGLIGTMIGGFIAFIRNALVTARARKAAEAGEFFQLIEEAKPRFFKTFAR